MSFSFWPSRLCCPWSFTLIYASNEEVYNFVVVCHQQAGAKRGGFISVWRSFCVSRRVTRKLRPGAWVSVDFRRFAGALKQGLGRPPNCCSFSADAARFLGIITCLWAASSCRGCILTHHDQGYLSIRRSPPLVQFNFWGLSSNSVL